MATAFSKSPTAQKSHDSLDTLYFWICGASVLIVLAHGALMFWLGDFLQAAQAQLEMTRLLEINTINWHHQIDLLTAQLSDALDMGRIMLITMGFLSGVVGLIFPLIWKKMGAGKKIHAMNQQICLKIGPCESQNDPSVRLENLDLLEKNIQRALSKLQEFNDQSQELALAKEKADEVAKIKGEFLANVGHEIRTPLAAVIGYIDVAIRTCDAQHRLILNKAKMAANGLFEVLNDILDVTKIDAGKIILQPDRFSLTSLFNEIANVSAIMAEKKSIQLLFDICPKVPRLLIGDSLRLKQVLMNLLSNAIKFTERGEVILSVESRTLSHEEVEIDFTVKDSGIGIAKQKMDYLFESFSQADGQSTRKYGGTGLGLFISKKLTQLMKGHIGVTSQLNSGSVFKITIPFVRVLRNEEPLPIVDTRHALLILSHNKKEQNILEKHLSSFYQKVYLFDSLDNLHAHVLNNHELLEQSIDWLMNIETLYTQINQVEPLVKYLSSTIGDLRMMALIGHMDQNAHLERLRSWGIERYTMKPASVEQLLGNFRAPTNIPTHTFKKSDSFIMDQFCLSGKRILLAEDTEALREITAESLGSIGAVVDCVSNGSEAIAAALNPVNTYDLILMDLQMPLIDGLQATRRIRERFDRNSLPIVALTAHALEHEKQRCLEAGMNGHLSKPVDMQKIVDWLLNIDSQSKKIQSKIACSIIDIQGALNRLSNNRGLLFRALKRFSNDYREQAQNVSQLNGDLTILSEIAHKLIGSAGTVGAIQVQQVSAELEKACEQHAHTDIRENLLPALQQALVQTIDYIDQLHHELAL